MSNNPLQFPTYEQDFTVTFSDACCARKATAAVAPLPFGKKIAFTTRWDDSNPRHLKQAQVLHAHGMKGTFLFNELTDELRTSIVEPLKELGSALGNHGLGHPMFFQHTPNFIFERVVLFQAELESQINAPIVSFTLPCNWGGRGDLFPGGSSLWGDWLARGSMYSFPIRPDMAPFVNRAPNCCFGTYLFSANDKSPDATLFREGFKRCYNLAINAPDTPRLTLGVHTWQNDEGFAILDKLYAEIAGRPEIWYCNENEYAAYRYHFYHAKIEKIAVNGNQATFRIHRFEPAFTGSPSELCIHFSEDAEPLILPDAPGHAMPVAIDQTESGKTASRFPGISASVKRLPDNQFSITVTNQSDAPLEQLVCSLILPPKWKKGLHRLAISTLAAGATFETSLQPGEIYTDPIFEEDRLGYDLQLDFVHQAQRGRIHFVKMEPYSKVIQAVPRDCLQLAGPFTAGLIAEEQIAPLTRCGTPLHPLGNEANLQWNSTSTEGCMPYAFTPCAANQTQEYHQAIADCSSPDTGHILFALEFEGGNTKIALDPQVTICFWIDGIRYDMSETTKIIPLTNGRHRIIVLGRSQWEWAFYTNRYSFGIYDSESDCMQTCYSIPIK